MEYTVTAKFCYKEFIAILHEYNWKPITFPSAGDLVLWQKGKKQLLTCDPTYSDYYDRMIEAIRIFLAVEKLVVPVKFGLSADQKRYFMELDLTGL